MTEVGQRVVVTRNGDHVAKGDVGWVIGHRGMDEAIVDIERDDATDEPFTAEVPISDLRVLTPARQGR